MSDDVDAPVRPPTSQTAHIEAQTSSLRATSYRWSSPDILLILVAVAYCIAGLLRVPRGMSPTWDEVVYLSQVATGIEPVMFSETRARGMLSSPPHRCDHTVDCGDSHISHALIRLGTLPGLSPMARGGAR